MIFLKVVYQNLMFKALLIKKERCLKASYYINRKNIEKEFVVTPKILTKVMKWLVGVGKSLLYCDKIMSLRFSWICKNDSVCL